MKQKNLHSRKTSQTASLQRIAAQKQAKPEKNHEKNQKMLSNETDSEIPELELEEDEERGLQEADLEDPSDAEIESSLPITTPHLEPEVSTISTHDPLKRYLEEIRRYPLLEPSEEFALAIKLIETGDIQVAKVLVSANLRLVVKIVFEYRTFYSNLLDLIQEGNIGLMKAVSKFDPTKGARLGYYASWWIRSYILKYLLDNFRLVRVGTTQAQKKLFYHLMREKEKLEAQGLLAGPKLLAEKLNVREKDVIEMEQRLSGRGLEMSLDAPIDGGEGNTTSHMDLLVDETEGVDESLAKSELLRLLKDHLPQFQKTLNEKELRILTDRLLAEDPKTLQEVADLYGLTRERARQIETKVIEKLRDFLNPIF